MEGNEERIIRERMRRIVNETYDDILEANQLAGNERLRFAVTTGALVDELARVLKALLTLIEGLKASGRLIAPPPCSNSVVAPSDDDDDDDQDSDAEETTAIEFPMELVINHMRQTGQLSDAVRARTMIANESNRRGIHLRNLTIQAIAVIQDYSILRAMAFNHHTSQVVNDLAPYGEDLLSEEHDCTAPKVAVDNTDAMRRRLELTYPHVESMGFLTAQNLFHAHLLLEELRESVEINEKSHAFILLLRQEIALLNNAVFSSTLRHLAIRCEASGAQQPGKKRKGAAPAFHKHDRVKHATHGSGTILQRSRSGKTYRVQFDEYSEPMPRIDPAYLTLITDDDDDDA